MIHGTVVGLQARIGIIVRLEGNPDVEIQFVVDTGFEGFLTLPPEVVAKLAYLMLQKFKQILLIILR